MKVILLNGSPRVIGNTSNILGDLADDLEREGIETEQIQVYAHTFEPCNDCRTCEMRGDGRCADEADGFNEILDKMRAADGVIIASPAYAGSATGVLRVFLERAALCLEKGDRGLRGKLGAVITVSEHDGAESAYMQLVQWMLRCEMIVVGTGHLTVFRALNSPAYEDDYLAMKGYKCLVESFTETLYRLTGSE